MVATTCMNGKAVRVADWLMAGVWRYILRLPPGIAKKKVGQLAKRARAEVGALSAELADGFVAAVAQQLRDFMAVGRSHGHEPVYLLASSL